MPRPFFRHKQPLHERMEVPVNADPPKIPSSMLGQKILDDADSVICSDDHTLLEEHVRFLFEDTDPFKHDAMSRVQREHEDGGAMAEFGGLTPCVRRRSTLIDVPPKAQHHSASQAHGGNINPGTPVFASDSGMRHTEGDTAQDHEDGGPQKKTSPGHQNRLDGAPWTTDTKEEPEGQQERGDQRIAERTKLGIDDLDLDDGARPGGRQIIRRSTFGRPIRVIVHTQSQQRLSPASDQETNGHGTGDTEASSTRITAGTTQTPARNRSASRSRSQSRSGSQSSLGQSQSQNQSHYWSCLQDSESFVGAGTEVATGRPRTSSGPVATSIYQPQTPGSVGESQSLHLQHYTNHHSTPRSFVQAAKNKFHFPSTFPSPDIFGMRRYSPSASTQRGESSTHSRKISVESSYFDFDDVPPPLPPLDHPAFKQAKIGGGSLDKGARQGFHIRSRSVTHSLPSLKPAGSRGSKELRDKEAYVRQRAKSNAGLTQLQRQTRADERHSFSFRGRSHARNQSVGRSSIASSRRSSAEYSAKQASSIGHEAAETEASGCWEVEVSRAIISMSLEKGGQKTPAKSSKASRGKVELEGKGTSEGSVACHSSGNTSAFGKARGENREPGGELWLGSPFLLQDPSSDSPRKRLRTDARAAPTHSYQINRLSLPEEAAQSRHDDMTDGDSVEQRTDILAPGPRRKQVAVASSRRGRGAPLSSSASGSKSRRGGPTLSMPSLSQAAAPLSATQNSNANQELGNMQGSSSLRAPALSVTEATPTPTPISPVRRTHHKSTPTMPTRTSSVLKTPSTPPVMEKSHSTGSGKRKAEEAGVGGDKTPPKESREPRATFAPEPRTHRASATSGTSTHAPSSFNRSKRVRLTEYSDGRGSQRSISRAGTFPSAQDDSPNAKSIGSWSSRGSHRGSSTSHQHGPQPTRSGSQYSHRSNGQQIPRPPSRHSLSQASIPISALISPHVASVDHVRTFHMRDPRKPSPVQSTPWSLSFPSHVDSEESRWAWKGWVERGGSPLHAWLFFIGFIIFPIWWLAALFIPVPRTRHLPADAEKGVVLDDPQVEHDAKSWRKRCRIMAGVSIFTYVPFIALVALYA